MSTTLSNRARWIMCPFVVSLIIILLIIGFYLGSINAIVPEEIEIENESS